MNTYEKHTELMKLGRAFITAFNVEVVDYEAL